MEQPERPKFWYVMTYYKVPVYKGQRVEMDGKLGIVVGEAGNYISVRFDGYQRATPVHPTWRMTYYNPDGTIAAQYGD